MTAQTDSNQNLESGMLLGGKYRLEEEIGRGAMGTVWSAIHESLDQRVAIKIISAEHAGSEELVKRFDTEARAAAKLRSRFVVGVSDNGTTESGLPYIVMEYLDGECLEDRIARLGAISMVETARIARHVTRALTRAHAHGIVHRDLKPANIFIAKSEDDDDGDDWTAKVLDFGIAKMDDFGDRSTTKTGTVLGTPLFMSPEQVRGASEVDSRADLYSLGMVVYNMLTGTYAFEGQSFGDLLVSICTDPLPNLNRAAPNTPAGLNDWFQRACARDPDARYQTSDEMMRALTANIDHSESAARLSMTDVTDTRMRFSEPLAETYAASDDSIHSSPMSLDAQRSRQGLDSAGAAASSVTVNEPPTKSSRGMLIALAAAACVLGLIGAAMSGASDDTSEESQTGIPVTEASGASVPEAPEQDVVDLDAKSPEGSSDDTKEVDTPDDAADAKPVDTKPAVAKKPAVVRPRVQPKVTPKVTAPAPVPKATPRPKPNPRPKTAPSEPDLGF